MNKVIQLWLTEVFDSHLEYLNVSEKLHYKLFFNQYFLPYYMAHGPQCKGFHKVLKNLSPKMVPQNVEKAQSLLNIYLGFF